MATPTPISSFLAGQLHVYVYDTRPQMGDAAAALVADEFRRLISDRGRAVCIFASAPSQNEFLAALVKAPGIDWERVIGFHLDEYLGIDDQAPQSFRRFLQERFLAHVKLGEFHGLRGEAADPDAECARYAELLSERQPGLAILGIGENGHLAFIDPPLCDFDDPKPMKVVELDEVNRRQQVRDKAFATLAEVPHRALSLTIPRIMTCPMLVAIVPGPAKQAAVRDAVEGPIATTCPASVLRRHPNAHLFLDRDSAALLSATGG